MPKQVIVRLVLSLMALTLPWALIFALASSSWYLGLVSFLPMMLVLYCVSMFTVPKWFVRMVCVGSTTYRPIELIDTVNLRRFSVMRTKDSIKDSWWHLMSGGIEVRLMDNGRVVHYSRGMVVHADYVTYWLPVDKNERIVHIMVNDFSRLPTKLN